MISKTMDFEYLRLPYQGGASRSRRCGQNVDRNFGTWTNFRKFVPVI